MATRTVPAAPSHAAQALTRTAPAAGNMIVVGITSGHHLQRAVRGPAGGYRARHATCTAVVLPCGRSRRAGE